MNQFPSAGIAARKACARIPPWKGSAAIVLWAVPMGGCAEAVVKPHFDNYRLNLHKPSGLPAHKTKAVTQYVAELNGALDPPLSARLCP